MGNLPTLSESEWKLFFKKEIASSILERSYTTKNSPLSAIIHKYRIEGKLLTELSEYLKGNSLTKPKFIGNLSEPEKEMIGFYKGELSDLLALTLYKISSVNYGYSRKKKLSAAAREIALPYAGNNAPSERSKFANAYETANCTTQLNLIHGVSKNILKKFIDAYRFEAMRQKNTSTIHTTVSETKAAKEFQDMTGIAHNILTINTNDPVELDALHKAIGKRPRVIRFCLKNFILNNIRTSNSILRHNATNHTSMYRSVQGCSGTIQSPFLFDSRMKFNEDFALGTDGRTINHLIAKKTIVHKLEVEKEKKDKEKTEDETPESARFKSIGSILSTNPNYRAIIDVGDYFKGIENEKVASEIAKFYKNREGNTLKFVLYFNPRNQLCALNIKTNASILIGSSNPARIQERLGGCPSEHCFTYYDELRTTGTDLEQMSNARALVTVSGHTKLKDLLQGSMRMRDLAGTHEVEIILPQELTKSSLDSNWDINRVLALTENNQRAHIKEDNFRAAIQKMKNVIRKDLLTRLKNETHFATKKHLYLAFDPVIHSKETASLFKQFGEVEEVDVTSKILSKQVDDLMTLWKQCLDNANLIPSKDEMGDIRQALTDIETQATPLCAPTTRMVRGNQDSEVKSVVDVNAQREKKAEATKEARSEFFRQTQLQNRLLNLNSMLHPAPLQPFHCVPINSVIAKISRDRQPPFKFQDSLQVSQDFYTTCEEEGPALFGPYQKPVEFIQYTLQGKELIATLITQREAILLRDQFPKEARTAEAEGQRWIQTPSGILFGGNRPKEIEANPHYQILTEQLQYINGDTRLLLARETQKETPRWLAQDSKVKMDFYEQTVLSCHPDKTQGFVELRERLQPQVAPSLEGETRPRFGLDI